MAEARDNPTDCTPTRKSDPIKEMNELYNTNSIEDKTSCDSEVGGMKCSGTETVTIVKETDMFIDYMNSAGEIIRITKQTGKSIDGSIASKLNSPNIGSKVEAKVADYIKNDMGIELTDFGNKVKNSTGQVIGDIDCATKDVLIEVKSSIASVKISQFIKYVDNSDAQYINVLSKKVILYIDEPLVELNSINTQKLNELKKMGVEIVNSINEMKGVVK